MPSPKISKLRFERGLCIACGSSVPKQGRKQCIECLAKLKVRSKRWKEQYKQRGGVCRNCGRKSDAYYCSICKSARSKARKKWSKVRVESGLCRKCSSDSLPNQSHCQACLDKQRQYRKRDRDIVFEAYGGPQCNCCGEKTIEFLTLDHINNDGAEHRRKISNGRGRGGGGSAMHRWLIRNEFPEGIQVLCANCQLGKQSNGICPHKL